MQHTTDYLIIGAGMAADAAAHAIREVDTSGRIDMVGAEAVPPYQRPPLSKALWKGDKTPTEIDLATAATGAQLHLGRRIEALDCAAHSARDDHGDVWQYRHALLANGATARHMGFDGGERLIHFRTLADYQALRRFAVPGASVAVVGGGFIGSELAASLNGVGCKVSMFFPEPSIGAGRYPDGLSRYLSDYYREHGVEVASGLTVKTGRAVAGGVELTLSDGQTRRFDVVVAGLGVTPNTDLAQRAGLAVDNGVVVDAQLRTSGAGVWAAGDVANFHSVALDQRMRVEHEDAAVSMGRHAGLAMAGRAADYAVQPMFYSDLFDLGYEAIGRLDTRLQVVEDWTTPNREGVVYYLDAGRVRGVLLWNVWDQVDAARELLAQPGPFDTATLRGRLPRPA